jgi:hypothetical protein
MRRRRDAWLNFVAAFTVVLMAALPDAEASEGELCVPVFAEMTATFFSEGCTSPVGLCTAGQVTTPTGAILGVASYTAQGIGGGVVGEASVVTPPVEPSTTWTYAGELVISTALGELVMSDVGIFDTAGGAFTEFDRVVSGTGLFTGASGTLFINGFGFEDGSGFYSDIRGTLCVPASHPTSGVVFSMFD